MTKNWNGLLCGPALAAILGVGLALLAAPLPASAATVCCYRYWGVTSPAIKAGTTKFSPTVKLIDWASVWVEFTAGHMTAHSQVNWPGASTVGSGGGGTWVYANPSGEVPNAYGRCHFSWDIVNPGYALNTYCDIKYAN